MTRRGRRMQPERATVRRFPVAPRRTPVAPSLDQILKSALAAKLDPAMAYAVNKTGLFSKKDIHELTQEEIDALDAALQEYQEKHPAAVSLEKQVSQAFEKLNSELRHIHPKHVCTAALSYVLSIARANNVSQENIHELLDAVRETMDERDAKT